MESLHSTEISDLPNEMLEQIFNFLKDPNDFLSVIGTCHRWNDIMAYRKTERLFSKVLPILHQADLLPLRSMLPLRQICRKWKEEAEIQLKQSPSMSRLFSKYDLEETTRINRFITHSNELPEGGNPFLGKYLGMFMEDPEVYAPVLQLIRQHGTQLKNVMMAFMFHDGQDIELPSILRVIPNVEILCIVGFIEHLNVENATVASPPLPLLNNLTVLLLEGPDENRNNEDRCHRLISYLLTAYGQQLETLRCTEQLLRFDGMGILLVNLRQLHIYPHDIDALTQHDVQVLSQVEWRLQELFIRDFYIQLTSEFLAALNNFSGTLEDLEIWIQLDENFDPESFVSFPFLKKLKLRINSELRNIPSGMQEKLMKCAGVAPNLEELDITLQNDTLCDVAWGVMGIEVMSSFLKKLNLVKFRR
ncbi:unnamed protein product [Orchesella dallaii]|uniref:F-box domain-containing protein n=1 Tax=Orchesella dallaii TaxID=48710 RepID=A0ABP1R233_9HEXA